MSQVTRDYPGPKHQVIVIESEKGWGQKIDEVLYYDNEAEALKVVEDYNNEHNPDMGKPGVQTPDWYMIARYEGKV
jgi:hypothetical protein